YPSGGVGEVAAASGTALPSMPAEMPPVSFDRRDRADALPTASTVQNAAAGPAPRPLSPGEQALVDHVWRHDGDAEVICIVRPRGNAQSPGDVFVLQGTGRDFVEKLSRSQAAPSAGPADGTPAARQDMAALPAAAAPR
ncbi:MAG: hypothetical protein EBX36_06545, partial [Planctomycetia bacterium]|nr:hypothetical protein [Planctomycetia bacterium]